MGIMAALFYTVWGLVLRLAALMLWIRCNDADNLSDPRRGIGWGGGHTQV